MTIVRLQGGVGNQLFQYATGRALAQRTDSELYLDTSRLGTNAGAGITTRELQLQKFNLPGTFVDGVPSKIHERLPFDLDTRLEEYLSKISRRAAVRLLGVYVEKHPPHTFDPAVYELPGEIILDGYWQTERYFSTIADQLRSDIQVTDPPSERNQHWKEKIDASMAVSVHVRRGDYVNLGWELPKAYYRHAFDYMARKFNSPELFFFSDDMDWVQDNLDTLLPEGTEKNVQFVTCNDGSTAYEDLRLMRSCDHHIIANSSFSWWGAWLNENPTKTVIAPNYWIRGPVDDTDIIPNQWEIINW